MSDFTYTRKYKDLVSQSDLLREKFQKLIEDLPQKEDLQLCFKEYRETQEAILGMAEQEISDLEWDKDEEIDDLKDEIEELEGKVSELEDKADAFDVNSLEDEMKVELFQAAMKKYTLVQLEEKLGNRFELM